MGLSEIELCCLRSVPFQELPPHAAVQVNGKFNLRKSSFILIREIKLFAVANTTIRVNAYLSFSTNCVCVCARKCTKTACRPDIGIIGVYVVVVLGVVVESGGMSI